MVDVPRRPLLEPSAPHVGSVSTSHLPQYRWANGMVAFELSWRIPYSSSRAGESSRSQQLLHGT